MVMFIVRLRFWLPLMSVTMFLGSAAVLAWSVVASRHVEIGTAAKARTAIEKKDVSQSKTPPSLKEFEPFLTQRFQGPLFDLPPPKPAPAAKKETPPPPIKLLATMPEPGGGCAMLSDASGATLVKSVGDQILGGAVSIVLVEVASDHVVVRQEEQRITLKLSP